MPRTRSDFRKVQKGYLLDIGCGSNKQPGFIGMDKRALDGVDIVHDLEQFPWPLEDSSCHIVVGHHIVEHIKPWLMLQFMDELWRIMKPNGQLALSMPYGWSKGFIADPTHCNPCNEITWQYFDPDYPLYKIYEPKSWKIEKGFPQYQVTGNLEVVMRARK
jgi:predicted SAM-dependent methyltransferase